MTCFLNIKIKKTHFSNY